MLFKSYTNFEDVHLTLVNLKHFVVLCEESAQVPAGLRLRMWVSLGWLHAEAGEAGSRVCKMGSGLELPVVALRSCIHFGRVTSVACPPVA